MKSYHEQRYPVEITVRVTYRNTDGTVNDTWIDGHKGLNPGHALYLAGLNWPGAELEEVSQ